MSTKIHLKKIYHFLSILNIFSWATSSLWTIRSTSNNRSVAVDDQCHLFGGQTEWGRNIFFILLFMYLFTTLYSTKIIGELWCGSLWDASPYKCIRITPPDPFNSICFYINILYGFILYLVLDFLDLYVIRPGFSNTHNNT